MCDANANQHFPPGFSLNHYFLALNIAYLLNLILAEVSRLFGPYMGGRRTAGRQTLSGPAHLHSYTHLFCCLEDMNAALVPNRYAKERLAAAGLGEKRLTFKGLSVIRMTIIKLLFPFLCIFYGKCTFVIYKYIELSLQS